jgi:hypothetical protein
VAVFTLLKPSKYEAKNTRNVPQLEIEDFTLYTINKTGVDNVVSGTMGRQFSAYYTVENAHYIENKNKLGEHLYADQGKFQSDVAYLDKNVRYFREDGLSFESDHAVYNTKKEKLYVPKNFVLTQNENVVYGTELHYNAKSGEIKAQEVDANYYTQEKK